MSEEKKDVVKRKLYFCKGSNPTTEEVAKAEALGIFAFRSAKIANRSDEVEPCAGAAGLVPEHYIAAGVKVLDKAKAAPAPVDKSGK